MRGVEANQTIKMLRGNDDNASIAHAAPLCVRGTPADGTNVDDDMIGAYDRVR